MRKTCNILITILHILGFHLSYAQIILNNGIIINMNGGISNSASSNLVLNSSPSIPIKQVGTTTAQGIILESEWNRIQYNLSTATIAITIPYISNTTTS